MIGGCAAAKPYRPQTYFVRPQDTLYSIAWRHNLDYRDLAKWNGIGSDYRLSIGQVLTLSPGASNRGAAGTSKAPPRSSSPPAPASTPKTASSRDTPRVGKPVPLPGAPAPAVAGAATKPATASPPSAGGRLKWVWPTDRQTAPRAVPGGGILLLGRLGQDVRAASTGRVVYTGSGLRGYGNLIIIKHGDSLLSSYAHNREMLVHEGQDVVAGQTIAHMGTGAHQTSALYFEIRINGKPTDPLRYLPATQ